MSAIWTSAGCSSVLTSKQTIDVTFVTDTQLLVSVFKNWTLNTATILFFESCQICIFPKRRPSPHMISGSFSSWLQCCSCLTDSRCPPCYSQYVSEVTKYEFRKSFSVTFSTSFFGSLWINYKIAVENKVTYTNRQPSCVAGHLVLFSEIRQSFIVNSEQQTTDSAVHTAVHMSKFLTACSRVLLEKLTGFAAY